MYSEFNIFSLSHTGQKYSLCKTEMPTAQAAVIYFLSSHFENGRAKVQSKHVIAVVDL